MLAETPTLPELDTAPQIVLNASNQAKVIVSPNHPAPENIDPLESIMREQDRLNNMLEKAALEPSEHQQEVALSAIEYMQSVSSEAGVKIEDTQRFFPYFISRDGAIKIGRTSPNLKGWIYRLLNRPVVIAESGDLSVEQIYTTAHEISHAMAKRVYILKFSKNKETVNCEYDLGLGLPGLLEEAFAHMDAVNFVKDTFPNIAADNQRHVVKKLGIRQNPVDNYLTNVTASDGRSLSTPDANVSTLGTVATRIKSLLSGHITFSQFLQGITVFPRADFSTGNACHGILSEFLAPYDINQKEEIIRKL